MERVADYVIKQIQKEGAGHIFLVTGRGVLYLSDAVAREKGMEGIAAFHEQGASYAAMAYAQSNGNLGACLVSTGCAAVNAVTGALCAWQDGIPCVFVSGQHMLEETTRYTGLPIRTYGSQETDIISIVKPITKYAVMITDAKRAAYEIEKAIHIAKTGRKGPVWLDIPLDIQNMRIDENEVEHFSSEFDLESARDTLFDETVDIIADELGRASRPVILVGSGVRSAGAENLLAEFIEDYGIPLVYTGSAADIYGSGNHLSIGAVGSLGGSRAGNFAVQNADYLLVIGSRLCSQTTGSEFAKFAREAVVTVVDIDDAEHQKKGIKIDRLLVSDAKRFLKKMISVKPVISCPQWRNKCFHWKSVFDVREETFIKEQLSENNIDLYYFADVLSGKLSDEATIITDAGLEELIIPSSIRFRKGQRCLFPASQGAMGYAVPAIIGAYYGGRRDLTVVVGDGSIMMNLQELQVISYHHIPVRIIVINNNMYAVIRKRQRDLFRTRTIGNDPSDGVASPDFERLAAAFDFKYMRIGNAEALADGMDALMGENGPVLCEVICAQDQKYFHSSYTVNKNRKVVRRPIEDMSPFLERDKFLAEMLIEPIDQ